jgi:signal transduction histidine kinase
MPTKTLNLPDHIELAHFVSVEAHDLRTPFNQLVGFSKIVLNGQDGPLTDLQREDLTIVYQSSLRALTLMNYLIDIARLSRSEKDPNPAAIDWPPLLDQAVAQWRRFNASRTLRADINIAEGVSAITADELQLKQVIAGLIAFAAEYVEDEGQIRIQVDEEPGWCVASIQSEGRKSRFQSKLDTEMLGYISRCLIELNRGVLRSACETDTGAAFCFALPQRAA